MLRRRATALLSISAPQPPERGLVTGYSDGSGGVLVWWDCLRRRLENVAGGAVAFEPEGQLRKRGWYENATGVEDARVALECLLQTKVG